MNHKPETAAVIRLNPAAHPTPALTARSPTRTPCSPTSIASVRLYVCSPHAVEEASLHIPQLFFDGLRYGAATSDAAL